MADRAGSIAGSFTVVVVGPTVVVTLTGTVSKRAAASICDSTELDLRPLLAPPVQVTCGSGGTQAAPRPPSAPGVSAPPSIAGGTATSQTGPCRPVPTSVSTSLPVTEQAYLGLSTPRRQQLAATLANAACPALAAAPSGRLRSRLACAGDGRSGYLLGPSILPPRAVSRATAIPPSGGSPSWTVAITLASGARSAWTAWTRAHNADGQSDDPDQCGADVGHPCINAVAFVLAGTVLSAPVTYAPINDVPTQIADNFSEQQAQKIARDIAGGALPTGFHAASVQVVR